MAGWNKAKVALFKREFFEFLGYVQIASKDVDGFQPLVLYNAQRRLLDRVFAGLEADKHNFVVLKGRQLGISTIVRCLIVFWAFIHEGLRIALVYDTESNKNDARAEIRGFLDRLPTSHLIPIKKGGDNRDFLELANGSRISYFVAGTKKTTGSSGLGRSRGINTAGCTEMSSWGDIEGLQAFKRSLSDIHPDRLYIWESTAQGFNIFHDIWTDAKADDLTTEAIFIGWWAKETYALTPGTPLFERYGSDPPDEDEQRKIDLVQERYGHQVTMEQLAWYRHVFDPARDKEGTERSGEDIIQQELPWYEEESWIMSGALFFRPQKLEDAVRAVETVPFKSYRYYMGNDFAATEIGPVKPARQAMLKVWEEPDPEGVYVLGADPAYGANENNDRYCCQVLRCYADGVDQVAEFCVTEMETHQFAWVIAHLCGAYRTARLLLELNGAGQATLNAFRELELLVKQGGFRIEEIGLKNIFENVRHFMYFRQDSIKQNPAAFHLITTQRIKVTILERMRDMFSLGHLRIRSLECLNEMHKITRDGDQIMGEGTAKDDRVIAMAIAVRAWEDAERRKLLTQQRTRENEARRRTMTQVDLYNMFSENLVADFLAKRKREAIFHARAAKRGNRYRF